MEDIYKTPQAELITDSPEETDFYVVSKIKFVLLLLLTSGLYHYYWFYKNWRLQKLKTGEPIWPVMRSIFAIFFVPSLFTRVDFSKDRLGIDKHWHPDALAGVYIFTAITSGVTNRLSAYSIGTPYISLMIFPLLFLECYILYRAQLMINLVCGDPEGSRNNRFNPVNIIFMVIGVCIWLILALGLMAVFFPELFQSTAV